MIVVHHLNNSRSQRILWLLEELGLPYEGAMSPQEAYEILQSAPGARLVAALEDADPLVVQRASQALAAGRRRDLLPAVVDVLERALRDGRIPVARASVHVLASTTGERIGEDPPAWRRALGGN